MRQSKSVASEIRSRIAEMLRCRMSGQINQMLRHFAPNTVVHCASSREGLLPPGIWEGADGLRAITRRTDENYEPLEHEILDILVDGQNAVVRLARRLAPSRNRQDLHDRRGALSALAEWLGR